MEDKEDITYPIKIKKELWKEFKDTIPRTENINDTIVELIKKEVIKCKK